MKTSFYLVLWILIYPILGLIPGQDVQDYSFIVALMAIWGVSWLLNRTMPNVITYIRASKIAPILEDVYTGNVVAFKKRLSREATIETVTAIYFIVTIAVFFFAMLKTGHSDWFALAIFGFFAFGAMSRSVTLMKAHNNLRADFTSETGMNIAEDTYKLDYSTYYEARQTATYDEMLPPRPRFYKTFLIASLVIAIICTLLGIIYIALGAIIAMTENGAALATLAVMYFLYGSLATYFGIKDFITCIHKQNGLSNGNKNLKI